MIHLSPQIRLSMKKKEPPFPVITQPGQTLAAHLEHTLLQADARAAQIEQLCREACHYGFAGVCVLPMRLALASAALAGTSVKAITVIGFPLGASTTSAKAWEAAQAIRLGAEELDMVMAIGALKERDLAYVEKDIRAVVRAAQGRPVKVIIETGLLTNSEKVTACQLLQAAGARFAKTSTGFKGGARLADIRLMRRTLASRMGLKASGGIRSAAQALAFIRAGATRIGTSAAVSIVTTGP